MLPETETKFQPETPPDPQVPLDARVLSDPRQSAAQIVGTDPDRIGKIKVQLDALRKQGILVDLNVSGISMFSRQVSWMELGILDDDVRRSRFTRGQKYLYPEDQVKRLRSLESRARQNLKDHSQDIAGFRPYLWVPYTAYEEWIAEHRRIVAEVDEIRQDFIERRAAYVDRLAADFTEVASNVWKQIAGLGYSGVRIDGAVYDDLNAFTDAIVSRAIARMPTVEDIQTNLHIDYSTALVYAEADLAADRLAADRRRRQNEIEREAAAAQKREAYLQTHLLERQVQHENEMARLAEQEQRLKIEAMIQSEAEHARMQLEQMVSPFEELFVGMRRRMADDAVDLLSSIRRNGYVRGKIAEKGRKLLEIYQLMATHDDRELLDRLIELKKEIGPVGDERPDAAPDRDVEKIANILVDISTLSHTAAQDLSAGPSRFSFVEY